VQEAALSGMGDPATGFKKLLGKQPALHEKVDLDSTMNDNSS
jgi:hypothetical protein